jgi:hypothetical protein
MLVPCLKPAVLRPQSASPVKEECQAPVPQFGFLDSTHAFQSKAVQTEEPLEDGSGGANQVCSEASNVECLNRRCSATPLKWLLDGRVLGLALEAREAALERAMIAWPCSPPNPLSKGRNHGYPEVGKSAVNGDSTVNGRTFRSRDEMRQRRYPNK